MALASSRRPGSASPRCGIFEKPIELQPWLDRCGCEGEDAERVIALLGDRAGESRRHARPDRAEGGACLMAIIVDNDTRLVVQGLTGSEGRFHGLRNRAYGTNLVAGVTPGKGGQDVEGVPGVPHRRRVGREAGREHRDDLRAGAVRSRRRSTRQSTPASRP